LKKGKLVMVDPPGAYRRVKNYSSASVAFGKNCIWFMYRNEDFRNIEIHRIDRTGNVVRIPLPQPARSSAIREIIVDKENTIWLCSDGDGIFKILDSPLRIFSNPIVEVTGSVVNHVFYSGNNTWFSTPTNKLVRKSQMGLQVVKTNLEQSPEIFYEGNTLLAHDSRDIYEGTLDGAGTVNFRAIISLPDTDFFQKKIIVYGKNTIIAAQDRFLTVWKNRKPIVQIPIDKNDGIEEIFVDQFNLLWLVTRFNGIQVFTIHPEDRASYLTPVYHYSKNNILGSPRSFVIDKTGLIWIGTRSDGLVGYKQAADRLLQVCHFDVSDGLTDNFISSLACDSSNNIVVGAQTGLDRILRERNGQYRIENVSKGGNFFGMISQAWADKEKSYALTSAGVLLELSRPAEVSQGFTPQLLLEEMRVNGSPASVAGVNFSHNQNNLSFFLAAPSFIDEKQVTYAYLLEGSGNRHWSDTNSANAMINLTNLSAGKYRLFVKAFFPSTYYPPAQLSYSFAIEPPFWRTWWARSIAALLLTTLVLVIARFYYRRKLEKQKQSLERQQLIEKERTRIATNMHDDLGAGLSRIKFLSQSILNKKINDQGIKIELEKITSFSDEMSEKMGDIVWALNEKNDTLADLVAYTRSYAMEYLANHNIHCDAKTPLNLPGNFVTGETRRNIFLSVKECLHNVVKHSRASNVSFTVELNGLMQIVIHDNGKGIDVDNRRAFSNGIENIRKRMKEINGDVEFSNDKGTRVTLTIPLTL
ncbi:MAG TPA: ATP-binding protein, partial [Chitinophagaceae bacterium]|nr:ATP-binding protein [Chitinophagaceae bacterium]